MKKSKARKPVEEFGPRRGDKTRWACFAAALVAGLFAWLLVVLPGCTTEDFDPVEEAETRTDERSEDFSAAIDLLDGLEDFDPTQVSLDVLYRLNRWIEDEEQDPDWFRDPLHAQLPSRLDNVAVAKWLPLLHFRAADFFSLREAVWLRDIANAVVRRKKEQLPEAAPDWFDDVKQTDGPAAAEKLMIAEWLFDWTIRNIQLDRTPGETGHVRESPTPGDAADRAGDTEKPSESSPDAPTPKPGTRYFVWEALQLGHADALLRARIFILLARQRQIDVVMLGPSGGEPEDGPGAQLPAVLLEDQLFLFDTTLGLPIPGPDGRGIATLQQARSDPAVLESLDVQDEQYPLSRDDLTSVIALVDAAPADLSQRMKLFERKLSGEQKMVLTAAPSSLAKRLRRLAGIADVRLWTVPYDAVLYRWNVRNHPKAVLANSKEFAVFSPSTPLAQGRLLQLRGRFDVERDRLGAKGYYLQCRVPDAALAELKMPKEAREPLFPGAETSGDPGRRAEQFERWKELLVRIKQNATYWLGLIAYECGRYDVAMDYFDVRTLRAADDGPWAGGARYNLARCYEETGQWERAVELYRSDRSPQRHGNLLRARRLEELHAEDGRLPGATSEDAAPDGPGRKTPFSD